VTSISSKDSKPRKTELWLLSDLVSKLVKVSDQVLERTPSSSKRETVSKVTSTGCNQSMEKDAKSLNGKPKLDLLIRTQIPFGLPSPQMAPTILLVVSKRTEKQRLTKLSGSLMPPLEKLSGK